MENNNLKISVIVDTNFLLNQVNLRELLPKQGEQTFEETYDIMTLAEVLKEVKDENVSNKSHPHLTFLFLGASIYLERASLRIENEMCQ
jgi:rRNA-processing protein FCF1